MMRSTIAWLVLTIVSASGLYLVKQEVIGLEDRLAALDDKIGKDRETIHVLRAEWAYLTQPDRLAKLAARHLGLKPPAAGQIADTIEKLPPPKDSPVDPNAPSPAVDPSRPTLANMKSGE